MKATILIVIGFSLFLGSCSKDDLNSVAISGKLVSEVTGEGIANATIIVQVKEYNGSGAFTTATEINSQTSITDANGNFNVTISYKEDDNVFIFEQIGEVATSLLQEKRSFYVSELNDPLVFSAREYEELQIKLTNTQPFDENDAIGIYLFQQHTNFHNSIIYRIDNFGDPNEPYEYPADDNGLNPYWIGDGVDSVIYGHIQEGTSIVVNWSVRKNGVVEEHQSEEIETLSGEVNEYEINY